MNVLTRWLWLALLMASLSPGEEKGTAAISASLVLKVDDREKAARAVIRRAEAAQGYFSSLGDTYVVIKLPSAQAESFLAYCDSLGLALNRRYEAVDQSAAIVDKKVKLKTRRDLLKDYFDMLERSTAGSVLTVERAMAELTAEIESLEADLKALRHAIDFAQVRIDFEFREQTSRLRSSWSLFSWINTLNLRELREDFEHGRE